MTPQPGAPPVGGAASDRPATGGREGAVRAGTSITNDANSRGGNTPYRASSRYTVCPSARAATAANRQPTRRGDGAHRGSRWGCRSVRETPGTDARLITRVNPGQEFTVMGGPQQASGYTWFQIRSDSGDIEGWIAEGDNTERWLSPLE